MQNLLPKKMGQALCMTVCEGPDVAPQETGHWYSPEAVELLLAAKREPKLCEDAVQQKGTCSYEGSIEIPLEDFWRFIGRYGPKTGGYVAYGVPKADKATGTLSVAFAVGDETPPAEWARKPDAVTEWEKA